MKKHPSLTDGDGIDTGTFSQWSSLLEETSNIHGWWSVLPRTLQVSRFKVLLSFLPLGARKGKRERDRQTDRLTQ